MALNLLRHASLAALLACGVAGPAAAETASGRALADAAPGLAGLVWSEGEPLSLDDALALTQTSAADATFVAGQIDYPRGNGKQGKALTVSQFLAESANALDGYGSDSVAGAVVEFRGLVELDAGMHVLSVLAEGAASLAVNGVEVARGGTSLDGGAGVFSWALDGAERLVSVALTYAAQSTTAELEFTLDGATVGSSNARHADEQFDYVVGSVEEVSLLESFTAALTGGTVATVELTPVPVPAAAPLMGCGILALAALGRRRRAA